MLSKPSRSLPDQWKSAEMSVPHVDVEKMLEKNWLKVVKFCSKEAVRSPTQAFLANFFRHAEAK